MTIGGAPAPAPAAAETTTETPLQPQPPSTEAGTGSIRRTKVKRELSFDETVALRTHARRESIRAEIAAEIATDEAADLYRLEQERISAEAAARIADLARATEQSEANAKAAQSMAAAVATREARAQDLKRDQQTAVDSHMEKLEAERQRRLEEAEAERIRQIPKFWTHTTATAAQRVVETESLKQRRGSGVFSNAAVIDLAKSHLEETASRRAERLESAEFTRNRMLLGTDSESSASDSFAARWEAVRRKVEARLFADRADLELSIREKSLVFEAREKELNEKVFAEMAASDESNRIRMQNAKQKKYQNESEREASLKALQSTIEADAQSRLASIGEHKAALKRERKQHTKEMRERARTLKSQIDSAREEAIAVVVGERDEWRDEVTRLKAANQLPAFYTPKAAANYQLLERYATQVGTIAIVDSSPTK